MHKDVVPFGDQMKMKVAFCSAISFDLREAKKFITVSGMLPFDQYGNIVGKGDIAAQTEQSILNMKDALEQLGATLDDVIQVTVFVTDMSGLAKVHEVRLKYFKEPYPTSTLVQISSFVNKDAMIEINALAVI